MIYKINPKIQEAKSVVIYGTGTSSEKLLSKLIYDDIYVNFFCDSNPDKWGKEFMGKKIISPEKLKTIKEKCVVLIASVYWKDIYQDLIDAGITNIFLSRKDVFGQPKG